MKVEKLLGKDWETLKSYLEIESKDEERLKRIGEVLLTEHEEIQNLFYEHLLSFEETSRFFSGEASVKKVKTKQEEYFRRLTQGNYDLEYLVDRARVGEAHDRISLSARWYLGAYRKYLALMMPKMSKVFPESENVLPYVESLLKLTFLDMAVAIETYIVLREGKLQESREHFKGIFEGANDGIFLIGRDYTILDANPAALKMLKLDRSEVVGNKCYEVVHGSESVCKEVPCSVKEVLEKGEVHGVIHTHYDCEGNMITVEITAAGIRDSEGNIVTIVESSRDITDKVKLQERLEKRINELERWRRAIIDRELRMLELKEENKRLKEELDRLRRLCTESEGPEND
ncbi:protoglobin domain-containing protein [Candidatus Pyrohabitans sp.]